MDGSDTQPRVWHPVFISLIPAASLYAANWDEALLRQVVWAFCVSVIVGLVIWGALRPLVRASMRRGVIASLLIAAVLGYGHYAPALEWIGTARSDLHLRVTKPLLVMAGAGAVFGLVRLLRSGPALASATRFLNLFAALAVALSIGSALVRQGAAAWLVSHPSDRGGGGNVAGAGPDIYVLMLDGYAGGHVLKTLYGFDNGPFLEALRARGFYVAEESHSNYPVTLLSLASLLNMEYQRDGTSPSMRIRKSYVREYLRNRGYLYVTFETGWTGLDVLNNSDVYLRGSRTISEFDAYFLNMTLLKPVLIRLGLRSVSDFVAASTRERIEFDFDQIGKLDHSDQPLFVFGHVPAPHPPYVFAADGSELDSAEENTPAGYVQQLQYVNTLTLRTIDAIRRRSPSAVIVVQGDHGPRRIGLGAEDFAVFSEDMLCTLNAFGFPDGGGYAELYPEISQINTFRVILNRYFGEDLPLLPDMSYLHEDVLDTTLNQFLWEGHAARRIPMEDWPGYLEWHGLAELPYEMEYEWN